MRKKHFKTLLFLILVTLAACNPKKEYQFNEGYIFGTIYHVIYETPNEQDYQDEIEKIMSEFDMSLSTYNEKSIISRINLNDTTVKLDNYIITVIKKSIEISEKTDGAFDITVAPLVNAWGFGFKNRQDPDSIKIDSLIKIVGYKKIRLENKRIIKDDPRIMLDAGAIAKGYSVDIIAELLESKGIKNYMVEIGGELRVKGQSIKKRAWRIGIDKPIDDPIASQREFQDKIALKEGSLATSGNYRNFYMKNGKKYAHTINPKTGFPVQHSLLSASVFAADCITADAYATAFMVMGLEKSIKIVQENPEIEAYFIYSDKKGNYKTYITNKMQEMILKD